MRPFIAAILGTCLVAGQASAGPLADLTWAKRVLLVFSDEGGAALGKQRAALSSVAEQELTSRDLVVLQVPHNGATQVLFGHAAGPYSAETLRRILNVGAEDGFTAILVGKDGGTKLRQERPVEPKDLFALIDSMPMRAREIERNRPTG